MMAHILWYHYDLIMILCFEKLKLFFVIFAYQNDK